MVDEGRQAQHERAKRQPMVPLSCEPPFISARGAPPPLASRGDFAPRSGRRRCRLEHLCYLFASGIHGLSKRMRRKPADRLSLHDVRDEVLADGAAAGRARVDGAAGGDGSRPQAGGPRLDVVGVETPDVRRGELLSSTRRARARQPDDGLLQRAPARSGPNRAAV